MGLEISEYTYFPAASDSAILTVAIENGSGDLINVNTRAVAEKTWDAFLNGQMAEPILWYPSSHYFAYNWTYDVQLRPDTSSLYLDFNVTSDETNMNATNIAPVYFTTADGTTQLDNYYVQSVVDQVWEEFQNGTWANNATWSFNNMSALRTWTFTEDAMAEQLQFGEEEN
jgi:hypothetical protein